MSFPMLTKEGKIGPMKLKNRMIMSSMGVNLCEYDGSLTEELIEYTETRAKGGVGLVSVGSVTVAHPEAVGAPRQAAFARDDQIPQYKELADRVHKHGAKLSLQLQHPGLVSGVSAFCPPCASQMMIFAPCLHEAPLTSRRFPGAHTGSSSTG